MIIEVMWVGPDDRIYYLIMLGLFESSTFSVGFRYAGIKTRYGYSLFKYKERF
jgi:hypothetical protein